MIKWQGYDWLTSERWGQIHPGKTLCWYDETAVQIDENGYLHLLTHKNPKYFSDLNVTSPIGIGLVSCTEKFSYGRFEIECKLPVGKRLWPAFWMWSFDSWPPEIDVFEGCTSKEGNYFKIQFGRLCGFWNLQTNVHYGQTPNNKNIRAKTGFFGFKNPSKHFLKYVVEWHEDKIEIFYNGYSVRKVTDLEVVKHFKDTFQNIILDNSVQDDIDINSNIDSDFVVKSFKYIKF